MFRDWFDRGRGRFEEINAAYVVIGVTAAALFVAIMLPYTTPGAQRGPDCFDMASPLGGNNRSLLAQAGNDQQELDLDIYMPDTSVGFGQSLPVNVTFINNDIGPVILYFPSLDPIISPVQSTAGLYFLITPVGGGTVATQALPVAQPSYISNETLHLLGSRARCTVKFNVPFNLLQSNITAPGSYRIQAFYQNNNPGSQPPLVAGQATPTATPAYPNSQGIWTGRTSSDDIVFTVQ
jgi:hypothetical protein